MNKTFTKKNLIQMTNEPYEMQYNRIIAKMIEAIKDTKGNIVVCFSGGKDSSLMLDMFCEIYKALGFVEPIKVAFADTTNETTQMKKFIDFFIKRCEEKYKVQIQLIVVKPDDNQTFATVVKDEGIPFISKMTASIIRKVTNDLEKNGIVYDDVKNFHNSTIESRNKLRQMGLSNTSVLSLTGWSCQRNDFGKEFVLPKMYMPLLDLKRQTGIQLTEKCCNILKKNPIKKLEFKNIMTGEQALESKARENSWLKTGCNYSIDGTYRSKPLASVSSQAILYAIQYRNIPICEDYGIVICENNCYKCSKAQRTGCALCGFGIKFDKDRFVRLQETEPAKVKFAFTPFKNGGAGYREVCEFANEYCNLKIKIPNI